MSLRDPHTLPMPPARRVVLLVLDGLRADLVGDPRFPNLLALRDASAYTVEAQTVQPSVTAVAMTSLLSGVAPADHGVDSDRFRVPDPNRALTTVAHVVASAGMPGTGVVRQVPWLVRPLARRIVRALGIQTAHFSRSNAGALLSAALPALQTQRTGFIIIHWPDCDDVGHRHGWMSAAYFAAVSRMDDSLGVLRRELHSSAHDTLLIAMADHGGGGRIPTHHDSTHPHDCTIPILLEGAGVHPQELAGGLTLLDVPATVRWALGLPIPESYAGTPIRDAFMAPACSAIAATAA